MTARLIALIHNTFCAPHKGKPERTGSSASTTELSYEKTVYGGSEGRDGEQRRHRGQANLQVCLKIRNLRQNQNYLRVIENRCYSSIISRNY